MSSVHVVVLNILSSRILKFTIEIQQSLSITLKVFVVIMVATVTEFGNSLTFPLRNINLPDQPNSQFHKPALIMACNLPSQPLSPPIPLCFSQITYSVYEWIAPWDDIKYVKQHTTNSTPFKSTKHTREFQILETMKTEKENVWFHSHTNLNITKGKDMLVRNLSTVLDKVHE